MATSPKRDVGRGLPRPAEGAVVYCCWKLPDGGADCNVRSWLELATDRYRLSKVRLRKSSPLGRLGILTDCGLSLGEPVGVEVLKIGLLKSFPDGGSSSGFSIRFMSGPLALRRSAVAKLNTLLREFPLVAIPPGCWGSGVCLGVVMGCCVGCSRLSELVPISI